MQVLNIFHVLVAIAMVAFILVQRGPGATAGAAFGSGASGTVFGARGAGSFLSRSTWILATLFCLISLVMAVVVSHQLAEPEADLGVMTTPAAASAPAETAPALDMPSTSEQASDLPAVPSEAPEEDTSDVEQPAETDAAGEEGAGG